MQVGVTDGHPTQPPLSPGASAPRSPPVAVRPLLFSSGRATCPSAVRPLRGSRQCAKQALETKGLGFCILTPECLKMYDATALTTPAPAKRRHFRAVYEPLTSTFMLNLATNQDELQDTKPLTPGLSFQGFVSRTARRVRARRDARRRRHHLPPTSPGPRRTARWSRSIVSDRRETAPAPSTHGKTAIEKNDAGPIGDPCAHRAGV